VVHQVQQAAIWRGRARKGLSGLHRAMLVMRSPWRSTISRFESSDDVDSTIFALRIT